MPSDVVGADRTKRVFVVEDAEQIARLVADYLREIDCEVVISGDGREALSVAQRERFDLIILDLMLPGLGGLEVCRALRASERHTPILMLTGRTTELDRIVGLEFGADDYMVKPFSVLELVARVKAIFRRIELLQTSTRTEPEQCICIKDLVIDSLSRQVFRGKTPIALTEKEFDLLHLLARNPRRVYSRGQLLDLVWGHGAAIYEYSVTAHVNRLRAKIESDPSHPIIIETVWGVGYRLMDAHG